MILLKDALLFVINNLKRFLLNFILGSSSLRRLELLKSIGVNPYKIIAPNIDEAIHRNEIPQDYVKRIAFEKLEELNKDNSDNIVLTADTIAFCGRRLIDKTDQPEVAEKNLKMLSGKRHRVITSICVLDNNKKIITKSVLSVVSMKRLSKKEIEDYMKSNEWKNVAGSYRIQGHAESFIKFINGSFSNIVGLPLYETRNILKSIGVL